MPGSSLKEQAHVRNRQVIARGPRPRGRSLPVGPSRVKEAEPLRRVQKPRSRRWILAGSVGALAPLVCAASVAWACVPQGLLVLSPAGWGAGSQSMATVSAFPDGETVELRWDSLTGPVLDSGTGPAFAKAITIPANAAGGSHIVIAAVTGEHADHSAARATFTIPGGPPDPGPGDLSGRPLSTVIPANPFAPLSSAGGRATRSVTLGARKAKASRSDAVTLRGKIRAVSHTQGCAADQIVALQRRRRSHGRTRMREEGSRAGRGLASPSAQPPRRPARQLRR